MGLCLVTIYIFCRAFNIITAFKAVANISFNLYHPGKNVCSRLAF